MKQTIFTFLVLSVISLFSCRKESLQLNIKQYDQQQIQNYITSQGLTGMIQDTTGNDSTGMYYKILSPGTGKAVDYPDKIYFVFTLRSFDGTYTSTDTIANHFYDYVGHINSDALPLGLQIAVHNILKYPGASMRLLIPSHLAYGKTGYGSGSSQVANNKIPGNACLDYYVHSIYLPNIALYDDKVIQNYMAANSLTGYTKVESKMDSLNSPTAPKNYFYYKLLIPATSSNPITINSTVTATFTGQIFNATIFSQYNTTGGYPYDVNGLIPGVQEGLKFAATGSQISLIIPSSLGYAGVPQSGVPAFSCLRFTWVIDAVTP
jgi:FKBP-type peptidyl-prolyl cis-trans isomerase FkpA